MAVIAALLGDMVDQKIIDYNEVYRKWIFAPKNPRDAEKTGKFGGNKKVELDFSSENNAIELQ